MKLGPDPVSAKGRRKRAKSNDKLLDEATREGVGAPADFTAERDRIDYASEMIVSSRGAATNDPIPTKAASTAMFLWM